MNIHITYDTYVESYGTIDGARAPPRLWSKTCVQTVRGCRCAHGVRKLSTDPSICDGHATRRCLGRLLLR